MPNQIIFSTLKFHFRNFHSIKQQIEKSKAIARFFFFYFIFPDEFVLGIIYHDDDQTKYLPASNKMAN